MAARMPKEARRGCEAKKAISESVGAAGLASLSFGERFLLVAFSNSKALSPISYLKAELPLKRSHRGGGASGRCFTLRRAGFR